MKLIQVLEHTTQAVKHSTFGLAILLIAGVGGIGAARGEYLKPIAATAQSYYAGDDRAPGHAIDGTGMTPNSPVTVLSTCGTGPGGTMWLSNGNTDTWITFDLGSVRKISGFHLWNYNEVNHAGRGVKTAGVYAGTTLPANGSSYGSAGAAWGTLVENFTFTQASGVGSYTGEEYTFATPVTTRYLQIYVTSNYGKDAYTGISEIRFAVPEADMLTFGLPGHAAFIDQGAKTISWTVPVGADVTNLAPEFTMSADATCIPASGTSHNFTNPVTYTVTSSDSATTSIYTVTANAALTWDANGATAPNPDGGAGTWDVNTTANWWNGTASVVWPALGGTNDDAIFANTAGTVTLAAGGVTANDLAFRTSGYTIQSNTLTLNGTTPTITTASDVSATINSTISGVNGLVKTGAGTLTLNAANNYSGGTTLNGGTLNPNNSAALGSGTLTLSGGSLFPTTSGGGYTYANPLVVTAGTTTTVFGYGGGTNPTYSGAMTGSGTIYVRSDRGSLGNTGISGDISGFTGTFSFDNSGNGVNCQFNGTTAASRDGSQAHFVTSGNTTGGPGALFFFAGAGNTFKIGDLAGPGGYFLGVGAGMTFEIGALNTDTTYAGAIRQDAATPVNVTKVGSGTLTLTGANSYTGATTVNAGRLVLQDLPTFSSSGFTLSGGSLGIERNASDLSLGVAISGSGAFDKSGTATLTLTGASSAYTGAVTVSAGTLLVNGALGDATSTVAVTGGALGGSGTLGGAVAMAAGTTLLNNSPSGVLTLGSVSFAGTGTVRGIPSATAAPIVVTNALTTTGGTDSITVDLASVPAANGTYHLIQFGSFAGSISDFKFPGLARALSLQKNGNFIDVAVDSANQPVWTGASSSEWSTNLIGSPKNWKLSSDDSPTDFLNIDSVVFPSLASSYDIDVSATDVAPSAMIFNNDSPNDYTLGGSMDITSGSLVKNGSGKLTISGVYTTSGGYSFPGGATLNNGSVVIDTETALGTGTRTFDGGTLEYAGLISETWTRATLVNAGGGTLDIVNATNLTHSGAISGSGVLTKTGAGTLTLPNASSYPGGITLNGGTLNPNNSTALGSGTLTLSGGSLFPTSSGGGYTYANPIVVTAATTTTLFGYGGGTNPTFTGALTGSGTIYVKSDRGGLGNTMINGDISGFTGTFSFDNSGNGVNCQFQGTTAASRDGSQTHFVTSGNTTGGPGALFFFAGAGNTFKMGDLAGPGGYIIGIGVGMTFEIGALNTDTTYAGAIRQDAATPVNVTKVGSGTLTLSGPLVGSYPTSDNSFTGNVTVDGGKLVGAALRSGSNTVFGVASNARSITVNVGATLEFQAPNTFGGHSTTSAPTLVVNQGTVTNSDPWATNAINNGLTNVILNNGILTSTAGNGVIDDIDGTSRPGEVYGAWGLNGTVSSTGTSLISTSTGIAGRVLLGSGMDTTFAVTSGTLTVAATLQAGDSSYLGGLIKTGAGKIVLSAVNVYSSPTLVNEGTLELTGSLVAASGVTAPSNITVASGATLAGSGTATGTLAVAGSVAPGTTGVGALGVGATTLSGTYACDLAGATADSLAITGNLNLTGATLTVTEVTPATAPSYVIATYTGSLTGTFATVPAGYLVDTATTGQIKLVKSGGGYSDWADSWTGPALSDKTPGGDPDGDGISNVMEYVIGGDPRVSSTSYLPGEAIDGTDLVLSYERSDASEADTTQTGQWSTNLTDWNDIAPVLANENAAAPDSMEIRIPLTNAVGGKLFGRLNVTKP